MKKILIADRDEGLKDAFRVVFPVDEYDFFYTSDGSAIERMASEYMPDIYIVNVDLDKKDGVEVYEDMQEREMLKNCRFFFIKDIAKKIDLSGYTDIAGVIEKPINFFKVHQLIAEQEDLIKPKEQAPLSQDQSVIDEQQITKDNMIMKEILREPKITFAFEDDQETAAFEEQLKQAINYSIEKMKASLIEQLTPVISNYLKNYSKQVLSDIAEKVVREEMESLLTSIRKSK